MIWKEKVWLFGSSDIFKFQIVLGLVCFIFFSFVTWVFVFLVEFQEEGEEEKGGKRNVVVFGKEKQYMFYRLVFYNIFQ